MGTAVKHPVSDRVKPSFVIFDIRALSTLTFTDERQSARMSKYKRRLNPLWHRILYSCTHMQQWASWLIQ